MFVFSWRVRAIPVILLLFICVLVLPGCPRHPTSWTPSPPYGTTTGTKDFDLTPPGSDPNGSPVNPRWAPQIQNPQNLPPTVDSDCKKQNVQPYQSGCTGQSQYLVEDTGAGITGALCSLFGDSSSINGHADWTAAVLTSFITTCKRLGIDPFAYLRDIFERISTHPENRLADLLPDRWLAARRMAPTA